MKKLEPSYIARRNKKTMVQSLWEIVWQFIKKLNIELPHDSIIPLLGLYSRELKTYVHIKMCTKMLTEVLLIVAPK